MQSAELGAVAADLRVAAQSERVAGLELEVGLAKLGVDRAKWVRNAADAEKTAQHFATEAARQHAMSKKAEAERSLVLLNKENYKNFVADAQIELILAALPQYVVELQHSRVSAQEAGKFLNELAAQVDRRHKEWLEQRSKDILGFVAKLATFIVDSVCKFYGLPPLGSIVNTVANGVIDLAEGRTGEGIGNLVKAYEMGGGKEVVQKGLTALGDNVGKWNWVKDIKKDFENKSPGGQGGAVALIRGFGESVLPDDFTSLFSTDSKKMTDLLFAVGEDPDAAGKEFKKNLAMVGDKLKDGKAWEEFLQGQALAARKRLYRGAVGLGVRESVNLLGGSPEQQNKLKEFLKNRLKVEVQDKDKIIQEMAGGIREDAVKGLHDRLTEIYGPFKDLRASVTARAEKARTNHQGVLVEYLKNSQYLKDGKGLSDEQIKQLIDEWRAGKKDVLAPLKEAARSDAERMLKQLQEKVSSEEFWKGIESGSPAGLKDLSWLPSLAENLIDGSLSEEMMLVYSSPNNLAHKEANDKATLQAYGETLKASLVAIRASVDIPVTVRVTKQFELQKDGAEVRVSREWEAELQQLLSEYYDEDGAKAKADIERYWVNIKDTFSKADLSKETLEVLSNPPNVTLPPEIRQKLEEFDRASAEVNAVCQWLLDARHFKEQIDQVAKIEKEADYQNSRKQFFDALEGELRKALDKLSPAIDRAGFPKNREQFLADLEGADKVISTWVQKDVEYLRLSTELAEAEAEVKRLNDALAARRAERDRLKPQDSSRALVVKRVADLEKQVQTANSHLQDIKTKLEPLLPGRDESQKLDAAGRPVLTEGRRAARKRMHDIFGLIDPESRQAEETPEAYNDRQFKLTKAQVKQMLARIEDGASGLFSTVNQFDREAYMTKFNQAAQRLDNISKEHAALAYGLQAAQSRALFNAADFRKKRAEVEYAIAEGYVKVVEKRLEEQRILLKAAQVEYQRSRTHVDLARVDWWLFDRMTQGQNLYNTPEFRRHLQKAAWRTARDAAFFVRVYNGLDINLPTPPVYWSPAAIDAYVAQLEEARKTAEAERLVKLDVNNVPAVLTIDKRFVDERGQDHVDRDGSWKRLRIAVRSARGTAADGSPVRVASPYPPPTSWFVTDDEVGDNWEQLRLEVKSNLEGLGLVTRSSPLDAWRQVRPEDIDRMSQTELLLSLNEALTRVQPPSYYEAALPSVSSRLLTLPLERPPQPTAVTVDRFAGQAQLKDVRRWIKQATEQPDGRLVMLNRLFLEARLPKSLPYAAYLRFPVTVDATETGRERTALQGIAVFIRQGSASVKQDHKALIKLRHLGDGWITVSERASDKLIGVPLHWPPQGFDTIPPTPEPAEQLQQIENNPYGEVRQRIKSGKLPESTLQNSFSTYYPFMGTYEILIPLGSLGEQFQYKVVLLGTSVEFADGANSPRRK